MTSVIQECGSSQMWQEIEIPSASEKDKTYTVYLPPWNRSLSEVICSCPSYEFRGRCRHQREALSRVCSWSESSGKKQSKEQKENHICPECGSATVLVEVSDE
jgi:hypothetical protein